MLHLRINGNVRTKVTRMVSKVVIPDVRKRLRKRSERRLIRVTTCIFSTVLLPDPCLKQCMMMRKCPHVNLRVLNSKGIRTKVISRCRRVKHPYRSIFLTPTRVTRCNANIGCRLRRSRVNRLAMVLCRYTAGDLRRISTRRTRLYLKVFNFRQARRIQYIRITQNLTYSGMMLRYYYLVFLKLSEVVRRRLNCFAGSGPDHLSSPPSCNDQSCQFM